MNVRLNLNLFLIISPNIHRLRFISVQNILSHSHNTRTSASQTDGFLSSAPQGGDDRVLVETKLVFANGNVSGCSLRGWRKIIFKQ